MCQPRLAFRAHIQYKQPRKSFKSISIRNIQKLELIHSAVCNSNRRPTRGGHQYFVTFINDFSEYHYTYILKTKDEVLNKFKVYKVEIKN